MLKLFCVPENILFHKPRVEGFFWMRATKHGEQKTLFSFVDLSIILPFVPLLEKLLTSKHKGIWVKHTFTKKKLSNKGSNPFPLQILHVVF